MGVLREEIFSPSSIPCVIDTSLFSNDDLQLFCESSDFIEKSRQMRKVKEKYILNSSIQKKSEEIFEVSEVNEIEYLKVATSAYNDIDVNLKNLSADIEKIFESFNENVSIHDCQESPLKVNTKKNFEESPTQVNPKIKLTKGHSSHESRVDSNININLHTSKSSAKRFGSSIQKSQDDQYKRTQHKIAPDNTLLQTEKDTNSDEFKLPSVKAKILFFNQLSNRVSKTNYPASSKIPKLSINDKLASSKDSKAYFKETLASKTLNIVKCGVHNTVEDVLLQPNIVKSRIKQFEHGTSNSISQQESKNNQKTSSVSQCLDLKGPNLVSKLRYQFDNFPKNPQPNVQNQTYYRKSAGHIRRPDNFHRRSEVPSRKINYSPVKPTDTISSYRSSDARTDDFSCSGSHSDNSLKMPSPAENYNPFIESEKSLKKLGEIVHTIRSIREQGMTDVSRDLFRKFRKSLMSASEKLAESKKQDGPVDFQPKKIAAVRPCVVSSGTFPRILEAIPKLKDGLDTGLKVGLKSKSVKNVRCLDRDLLNNSELTYESFASILQRDQPR